jgi:hypothetical protein
VIKLGSDLVALLTILLCALLILAVGGTYVHAMVRLASVHHMLPWLAVGTPLLGAGVLSFVFRD